MRRPPLLRLAAVLAALLAAACNAPSGPSAASLSRPGTIADTWRWDSSGSRGFLANSYAGPGAGTRPPY